MGQVTPEIYYPRQVLLRKIGCSLTTWKRWAKEGKAPAKPDVAPTQKRQLYSRASCAPFEWFPLLDSQSAKD